MGAPNKQPGMSALVMEDPIADCTTALREAATRRCTVALGERLEWFFERWEREHGFQPGAGKILVPNGYDPTSARR